jgi:hypothetical protein
MTVDLLTPILVPDLRAVNFFNGRFVSGEDMTDEQNAQRAAHQFLGTSIGDGVVSGLEVVEFAFDGSAQTPLLAVHAGTAINRRGEVLCLPSDTIVRLARPPIPRVVPGAVEAFHTCTPPEDTAPLTPSAIYLLTICSSRNGDGTSSSSGMGALRAHCNMRWVVESVEFRLVNLNVSQDLLNDPDRLRNEVSYACFGTTARREYSINPFGEPRTPPTLIDALRGTLLTDCDVPLAILQWTTDGVQFVDLWSVRRRCASGSAAAGDMAFSNRAPVVTEAARNQFDAQLDDLRRSGVDPETVEARRHFHRLPSAGLVPVTSGAVRRFKVETFFNGKTCSRPWFIEAGDVEAILAESVHYPPVDLDDPEMVWLYYVHENRAALPAFSVTASNAIASLGFLGLDLTSFAARTIAPRPIVDTTPAFVLFANANMPFFGDARFNRSHFDFSNFG